MGQVVTFSGSTETTETILGELHCSSREFDSMDNENERPTKRGDSRPKEKWLRIQATQIVAQLPDNTEDAKKILDLAKVLVERFIAGEELA